MITLSQGKTYDYVIQGVFTIILGIILFFWHPLFGLFIVAGTAMILLASGVQIDTKNNTVRKYFSVGFIYIGKWKRLENISKITLKYNSQKGTTYRPIFLSKDAASLRTYDLVFSEPKKSNYVFFEFIDYKTATKALEELSKITPCEIENQIHAHRLEQQKRRRRR